MSAGFVTGPENGEGGVPAKAIMAGLIALYTAAERLHAQAAALGRGAHRGRAAAEEGRCGEGPWPGRSALQAAARSRVSTGTGRS
jgi:hypothetical protein